MTIGICGFGFSGSGALLDWLKDYPEVCVMDKFEFSFPYKPDGLCDLGNAICYHPSRYFSSDSAIRRFIQYMNRIQRNLDVHSKGNFGKVVNDYLSRIIQLSWKGSTSVHYYQASTLDFIFRQYFPRRMRRLIENKFHIFPSCSLWPEKKMYFSIMKEEDYINATKVFVSDVIKGVLGDEERKMIVLDQCFAANDPKASFKFFESPKAITVVRDPRDNYILAKKGYGFGTSFIPRKNVRDFVVYYRGLMESRRYDKSDGDIVEVHFEDLIYNPCETFAELEHKLSLTHIDVEKFTHFRPEISINNTQLWRKYPQFIEDMKYIEKELNEYLYPFERYDIQPTFTERVF